MDLTITSDPSTLKYKFHDVVLVSGVVSREMRAEVQVRLQIR